MCYSLCPPPQQPYMMCSLFRPIYSNFIRLSMKYCCVDYRPPASWTSVFLVACHCTIMSAIWLYIWQNKLMMMMMSVCLSLSLSLALYLSDAEFLVLSAALSPFYFYFFYSVHLFMSVSTSVRWFVLRMHQRLPNALYALLVLPHARTGMSNKCLKTVSVTFRFRSRWSWFLSLYVTFCMFQKYVLLCAVLFSLFHVDLMYLI